MNTAILIRSKSAAHPRDTDFFDPWPVQAPNVPKPVRIQTR